MLITALVCAFLCFLSAWANFALIDYVAKILKKPQKKIDAKMKELGYGAHVPHRPKASAARSALDKLNEL